MLITGSRGFIGSSLGRFASRAGHEVMGLGLASQPVRGWRGEYAQVNVATSDLAGLIKEYKPELVVHAAGAASVSSSWSAPLDDLKASTITWANTLDSIRRSGLRPVVLFPSSAAVYGSPTVLPVREDAPVNPISPYGFHKVTCELLAREYAACFGLTIIVCRLFSVFGGAQQRLLLWELYEQLTSDAQTAWLEGTGEESRDYLHIDDVASAFFELAENTLAERSEYYRVVNVASGTKTNILELARRVRDLVAPGKDIQCRGAVRIGDPPSWQADIRLLHSLAPKWQARSLEQGLAECIAEWKSRTESQVVT